MAGYRDLRVWQEARRLVSEVYHITYQLPPAEIYALSDQMRRAVVSIGSNIAEGQGRGLRRTARTFSILRAGQLMNLIRRSATVWIWDLEISRWFLQR